MGAGAWVLKWAREHGCLWLEDLGSLNTDADLDCCAAAAGGWYLARPPLNAEPEGVGVGAREHGSVERGLREPHG